MSEPIVYVDRSGIRKGKLQETKAAMARLVDFVEAREPRLLAYGTYLDPEGAHMSVVALHPDPASLELHMEVGGPEFRRFADLIDLRSIEVFGRPSGKALDELHRKAASLGDGGGVIVHERYAGFSR